MEMPPPRTVGRDKVGAEFEIELGGYRKGIMGAEPGWLDPHAGGF